MKEENLFYQVKQSMSMPLMSDRDYRLPHLKISEVIKLALERKGVLSLGHGEPDFALPLPLQSYLKTLANKCNHYSQAEGRQELKVALAAKLEKENSVMTLPENIVVTSGSTDALLLGMAACCDIGSELILPNPSFMAYEPTAEMLGINIVPLPLREEECFAVLPERIEKLVTKKTSAVLVNTPANPTGTVLAKKNLEEIADVVVENDLFLLSDEAYEKIVYGKKHVSPAALNGMSDYVLTFQSFSKTYAMCGFRVGYCSAPADVAKIMGETHIYSSLCAPTISQMLGLKALTLNKKYIDSMVREYRRRRNYIVKRLDEFELRCTAPEGAFYAFPNITKYAKNSSKFTNDLLNNAGVIALPGTEFGRYGEGHIRLSYASSMKNISVAMDRIEKFLKKK